MSTFLQLGDDLLSFAHISSITLDHNDKTARFTLCDRPYNLSPEQERKFYAWCTSAAAVEWITVTPVDEIEVPELHGPEGDFERVLREVDTGCGSRVVRAPSSSRLPLTNLDR